MITHSTKNGKLVDHLHLVLAQVNKGVICKSVIVVTTRVAGNLI